jgi:uncharacterized repeat protein (TIGR01451 family)
MFYHSRWLHLLTAIVLVLTSFAVTAPPLAAQSAPVEFIVDNLGDADLIDFQPTYCDSNQSSDCSLRQAIELANNQPDGQPVTITFLDNLSGEIVINNSSGLSLPSLENSNTTVLATLDTISDRPRIAINGNGDRPAGISIRSANNQIQGLSIYGFTESASPGGVGIYIAGAGATGNVIVGNYIGVDANGTPRPNNTGIRIYNGARDNQIGGITPSDRNTISSNNFNGIFIEDASNNIIQGNDIGLARVAGAFEDRGNGSYGVQIASTGAGGAPSSSNNLVGGTTVTARNFIVGNDQAGILILGTSATTNTIQGNFIGVSPNGLSKIANGDGIRIDINANNNIISGSPSAPMVISGNNGYGVLIRNRARANQISGSYIGTQVNGTDGLGNGFDGIRIERGATNNLISGTSSNRMVISSNGGYGVAIRDINTDGNQISGTFIGTGLNGAQSLGNTTGGVLVDNRATNTRILGTEAARSVISGNGIGTQGSGVLISGTNTLSTTIQGVYIGVRLNGLAALGNGGDGIRIQNGAGRTIINQGNVIASNDGDGISIEESGLNIIGGPSASAQNVISDNDGSGVVINGANAITNTVSYNIIGLRRSSPTAQFDQAAGNGANGVWIANGARQTDVLTNTIAFSGQSGVLVEDSTSTAIRGGAVRNNTTTGISISDSLTTTVRLLFAENNTGDGIVVGGSSRYAPITQNTIRNNGAIGVRVTGAAQRVRITENVITGNGNPSGSDGIRLDPSTVPGNPTNPNHDIDPPFALRLNQNLQLTGRVLVDEGNPGACITCTIHVYTANPLSPDRQGQTLLEFGPSSFIVPDASGLFTATLPLSGFPKQLVLTTTDIDDNTSEFVPFVPTLGLAIAPPRSNNAIPGETITYTHRITNTGSVDLTDLRLQATSTLSWTTSVSPTGQFTVRAGESLPVDLRLTLPTGSAPNVRAGLEDETGVTVSSTKNPTVTASLTDTTTVLEKFVLAVSPVQRFGTGQPDTTVPYVHTLTNNGNITQTVTLAAATDLGSNWTTETIPISVTLGPGRSSDLTVRVRVPLGAQSDVTAITTVQITTPDPSQNKVVTDTTRVTLEQLATMTPNREGFATAGTTITFEHVVENLSNGTATFKLGGGSGLGSRISFRSNMPGVRLEQDNSFTIGNLAGSNQFSFLVEITIPREALPRQRDLVNIFLSDSSGNTIGGATVQDTVNVAIGQNLPRIWVPVVMR